MAEHFDVHVLYWEDYPSSKAFLQFISRQKFGHVHFFFREHLKFILETITSKERGIHALVDATVTTHIPDYLYSTQAEIAARLDLFTFLDGYFVTNSDLFQIYSHETLINNPDAVIFDWPKISGLPEHPIETKDAAVRLIWCGNSKWGEYAGHVDYKGLKRIVEPAIALLRQKYINIEFCCLDSAVQKVPHETVLIELSKSDILLIASTAEGTPLTFIEAIASGCAVVSTRVGIVEEVLREDQQCNLVEGEATAFVRAISRLIDEPSLLESAKASNLSAYEESFGAASTLREAWVEFLKQARQRNSVDGAQRKSSVFTNDIGIVPSTLIRIARYGASIVRRLGLIGTLNSISPRFGRIYNKLIHSRGRHKAHDYVQLQKIYERLISDVDIQKPIVIYAPMWKGVAASTEALFQNNIIKFPYFDTEYPEIEDHDFLENFCSLLEKTRCKTIIYSGGSLIHQRVANTLKQRNPALCQYFLWHGSPAQWVEIPQLQHYKQWHTLYKDRVLDGFITLKPALENTLRKIGITTYTITNPIPQLQGTSKTLNQEGLQELDVGVFSALSSWYKNPYVQLLALAGNEKARLHTNLSDIEQLRELNLGIAEIITYPHLSRLQFLTLLASLDINLYVTNTECSPMIALESWALGVPCLVGPAGDVYSCVSEELARYLVVAEVDNPTVLSRRLQHVSDNIHHVKELLDTYKDAYNQRCGAQLEQLNRSLLRDQQ